MTLFHLADFTSKSEHDLYVHNHNKCGLFQRIDLRDNSLKVAGLMALALALKVNMSVTQLDLDDVPKKRMVSISAIHLRTRS
jgi:hypothetical protein